MVRKTAKSKKSPSKAAPSRRWWLWLLAGSALVVVALTVFGLWQLERFSLRIDALRLVAEGKYDDAEDTLRQALDYAPNDVELLRAMVVAQQNKSKRDFHREQDYLTRWCQADPDNPEAFETRMVFWRNLEQRDKALADGLRVLELQRKNYAVRKTVASLLVFTGQPDEALTHCRLCLQEAPGDVDVHYLLAKLHHMQGDTKSTDTRLQTLLDMAPEHPWGLLLRGQRLCEQKQYADAIPILERTLGYAELAEQRQKARYYLSQALQRTGKDDEARKVLAENRRIEEVEHLVRDSDQQPDRLDLRVRAAKGLFEIGREKDAVDRLQKVLKRDRRHREANRLMAEYHERHGRRDLSAPFRRLAK